MESLNGSLWFPKEIPALALCYCHSPEARPDAGSQAQLGRSQVELVPWKNRDVLPASFPQMGLSTYSMEALSQGVGPKLHSRPRGRGLVVGISN
jgi:hypothetical protein